MAAETTTEDQQEYGYTIDGEVYPEPEDLTMDDHRIVKRYTGWNFRDLAAKTADAMYVDADGIAAVMHISYRHKHPEMSFEEIAEIVGRQSLEEAQKTLEKAKPVEKDKPGEAPLALRSTTEPDASSSTRKPSTSEPSGNGSPKSSEISDESLATTETDGSTTSSPESVPETTEVLAS